MSLLTIHDILAQFRDEELHNRHLGDRFERLMCRYLELDPIFADQFSNVWMWNEWPQKGNVGDIGIDIVAEERATGEFCGIQCKFYLPKHTLSKDDIDSFLNALGDKRFTSGIIISTTDKWGSNAEKSLANRDKPVRRLRVQDLDDSPIDWSKFSLKNPQALSLRTKKKLRPHQTAAKTDVTTGLVEADRGKLIMACGTGKTFTSLRLADLQLSDLAFPTTTSVGIQDLLKDDSNQLNVDDAAQSPVKRLNSRQRQRHRRLFSGLFSGLGPHAYLDAKNISNTLRTSAHRI